MTKRKFRTHKKFPKLELVKNIPVKQNKKIDYKKVNKIYSEINLSEHDMIIYMFETDEEGTITKIVNVSYQTYINNTWMTILRYDNEHGFLHRHMRISLCSQDEIISTAGVKKKGTPHNWLTWAIEDTKDRYFDYKRGFLKRSKIIDKKYK